MNLDYDIETRSPDRYVVAIYELDRAYGGPEEGGWWFTTGSLVRTVKVFRHREQALRYMRRMDDLLDLQRKVLRRRYGRRNSDINSVIYAGGHYSAQMYAETAPRFFPDRRPHYE